MTTDIILFSPHPDDAEIFCGASLAKFKSQGHSITIVDACLGELGSQGTVEERKKEVIQASKILEIDNRINLELPDGFSAFNDKKHLDKIVKTIREIKPKLIFAPFWQSRHPDHSFLSELVKKASFFAGLKKYEPNLGKAFRANTEIYYPMRVDVKPSFIIDVSANYKTKLDAINCYNSQVIRKEKSDVKTLISSPLTIHSIKARDSFYGAKIGVEYGEPFVVRTGIKIEDPVKHFNSFKNEPGLIFEK